MESSFEKSKSIYKSKLPEIEQTLELVKLMVSKSENEEEMITNYGLSDTLYAKAQVIQYSLFPLIFFILTLY